MDEFWIIQDFNGKVLLAFNSLENAKKSMYESYENVTLVDEKPYEWAIFKTSGECFYTIHCIDVAYYVCRF